MMKDDLTPDGISLVEYSKEAVIRCNRMRHSRDGIDTQNTFLLPDNGAIYDGAG
jgi:hypothetical protein